MRRDDARARLRALVPATVALALALGALTGCGDDDSGSESGAAGTSTSAAGSSAAERAKKVVAAARAPLAEFDGPTAPPGKPPAGKRIAVIYPLEAPLPSRASQSVATAAKTAGWSARLIDGRGTPQGYVNAMRQALSSGADGIVLVAMPVPLLQGEIRKADAQKVPVVAVLPSLPKGDDPPQKFGLFDYVTGDHDAQGKVLGNWVVANAPDGAKVIRLTSPEFPDLTRESDEFAKTLEAAGPKYEVVEVVQSPVTDILGGPQGVQRLAAAMRKHPDAKYMFILSESWSQIFLQAKKLTGNKEMVGLGSDGDLSVPLVKKGEPLVMIGPDTTTYGWYATDALIRAFNGKPPVRYEVRSQLVDEENAKDVDGTGITATYDFPAEWKRLWGVQG